MLLVLHNNLTLLDTHDAAPIPSFWFEQWDKKKKKKPEPVTIEHKALEVLVKPTPIAAKQVIEYKPKQKIAEQPFYDDEDDELILLMGI
jgi:hypothetical protein